MIEESVKSIPIIIEKNQIFYKEIEDYFNRASEILEKTGEIPTIKKEDFYDRAVY